MCEIPVGCSYYYIHINTLIFLRIIIIYMYCLLLRTNNTSAEPLCLQERESTKFWCGVVWQITNPQKLQWVGRVRSVSFFFSFSPFDLLRVSRALFLESCFFVLGILKFCSFLFLFPSLFFAFWVL